MKLQFPDKYSNPGEAISRPCGHCPHSSVLFRAIRGQNKTIFQRIKWGRELPSVLSPRVRHFLAA